MNTSPTVTVPAGETLVATLRAFRAAFLGIGTVNGIINVLALTGSFFMLQVYDRIVPGRSVPTLVALGILAAVDVLKLADLNVGDVTFDRSGAHVTITVNSTDHVITLDEQLYSATANWGIEQIKFADGTVLDRTQIQTMAATYRGNQGDDVLADTSSLDAIYGGSGNDKISGGDGEDQLFGGSSS